MHQSLRFVEQLRLAVPQRNIDRCIDKRTDTTLVVCETGSDNTPCCFGQVTEIGFRVDNPDQVEICLLAVDHCLLTNKDQQRRCDCIIFDERFLCFVELKLKTRRQVSEAIREAEIQLETTINFLKQVVNAEECLAGFAHEAYVVLPVEPKPALRASFVNRQERFASKNQVVLFLQSFKSFAVSNLAA